MGMVINKYEIWLVNLDPTIGSEIRKVRPAVIISPNPINHNINTVIIAPMTTKKNKYPTRVDIFFEEKNGQIVLDQIRTIDKSRLIKKIGSIDKATQYEVTALLQELFSY